MNQSYHTTTENDTQTSETVSGEVSAVVVKIYSSLLDIEGACWLPTYLVIRSLDDSGCGWVDTSLSELGLLKGCSAATIRRHLSDGMGVGFRRYVKLPHGKIRIYYVAVEKVFTHFHIRDIGGIGLELSTSLTRSGAKACSTALLAQYLQKQALYAAKQSAPSGQKNKVLDARKFLEPTCDNSPRVKRSKHIFCSDGFTCPGTSIKTIALKSGRSIDTIKQRLSNNWRLKMELDLIQKKRVATEVDSMDQFFYSELSQSFIDLSDRANGKYHLIKFINGRAYRLGVNVYETSYELSSCRYLRSKVKRAIDSLDGKSSDRATVG